MTPEQAESQLIDHAVADDQDFRNDPNQMLATAALEEYEGFTGWRAQVLRGLAENEAELREADAQAEDAAWCAFEDRRFGR